MTEITTFKGNWAEFPGEPTFMGRRLLESELQMFDRACAFAKRFRDLYKDTGVDFNRKYMVEKNYRHNTDIDYDEIAWLMEVAPDDEYPPYPDGGRVGDMVYFDCIIHAESRATFSYQTASQTVMQTSLNDRWQFGGITISFAMHSISIDGHHPLNPSDEWYVMCHSEPNRGYLMNMEDCFAELREKFLDNEGYKLRPLSDEEAAQFPNTDEGYCVSKVIPC